ncbi:outer membrane beta-barrel protein [Pedobacter rhizosphaerae]|uniref:Outer membrane protein beta-barrel domain-containing protein n=1 Tax=Pedobacter rhizosphaerae TaxID=390241 RepID=A0A1H9S0P9_9SPHI|nr:outer membrane beta-barrel protein [Pedobacter rhizosphaerae]SER78508.1 hypothetical protein SAMN04488023_11670 [Pedobacter rhizosphaerae]
MKKALLFLLSLFIYFQSTAQTPGKRSYISIAVGPSLPIGDFGSKDLSDEDSGLAKMGGFVNISYGYKFTESISMLVLLRGGIYGVDTDAFLKGYATPDGSAASLSVSTTTWKTGAIMAGIQQSLPLNSKKSLLLETRAAIGIQKSKSPATTINMSISGFGNFSGKQEPMSSTSAAYFLGLSLNYNLGSNISLKFNADYTGANPKFEYTLATNNTIQTSTKLKQNISVIDLGIGLGVSF